MQIFVSLLQNIAMLSLAICALYALQRQFTQFAAGYSRDAAIGLVLGAIAALVILQPIPGLFGSTFDTRAGPLVLAGYFGGPLGGLLAAAMGGAARFYVGGPVVIEGVAGCVVYAGVGTLFPLVAGRAFARRRTVSLLCLSTVATVAAVPAFFIGGNTDLALGILEKFGSILVLQNVLSIVFLGTGMYWMFDGLLAQEALRAEHETAALARHAAGVGVWKHDRVRSVMIMDPIARDILGLDVPDGMLPVERVIERVYEADRDRVREVFAMPRTLGEHYEHIFRIRMDDGAVRHVRSRRQFVGGLRGAADFALGVVADITEQVRLTEELFLQAAALDHASCGVMISLAAEGRSIVFANRAMERISGNPRSELIGRNVYSMYARIPKQSGDVPSWQDLDRGETVSATLQNRKADGTPFWDRLSISPIRDENGTLTHFVGIHEDVTAERATEERFQRAFDSLNIGCAVTDADGNILLLNPQAEEMFGRVAADVVGEPIHLLLPQEDQPDGKSLFPVDREILTKANASDGRELTAVTRFGERFPVLVSIGPIRDAGTAAFIVSITDLSEKEALERRFMHAQRMEAVGRLTGGIAHDFNNVMTTVLGSADLLNRRYAPDAGASELIDLIRNAVKRGADLTNRLLMFSRQQPLSPIAADTAALIDDLAELMLRTVGENIELSIRHETGLLPALCDTVHFESALLNLVINAQDAMPSGGRLDISSWKMRVDEGGGNLGDNLAAGDYVCVAVRDTGSGIARNVIEKVFDPFFTTKPVVKGSGMGLSMVYGFAKQSRGHVTIESEPGLGTEVRLYLPCAEGSADAVPAEHAGDAGGPGPASVPVRSGGRILLVEDEAAARRVAAMALTEAGYHVAEAGDGLSAVGLLGDDRGFDLLFCDVVLPGEINGAEVAELALRFHPSISVVLTSGYTDHALSEDGELRPGVTLLHKPYSQDRLLAAVSEKIGRPNVLLIEDDEDLKRLLAEGMEAAGFHVTTASGGGDGLKILPLQSFDAVVSDIVMEGGEGVETLIEINRSPAPPPVIGISGYPEFLHVYSGFGAAAVLEKPFEPDTLVRTVKASILPASPG